MLGLAVLAVVRLPCLAGNRSIARNGVIWWVLTRGGVQRVVVIVVSVLFFRNPMTQQAAISTAVALAGVAAYSQAKRFKKSKFVEVHRWLRK